LIDEEAEGLTEEQIKKLRSSGIKRVRVAQTIPFAPLLFLGAMLTIIAKGNIFIVLKLLIFK
jgi:prepilin signal peptidase PulO-like enzyme (type II secretory pathway)